MVLWCFIAQALSKRFEFGGSTLVGGEKWRLKVQEYAGGTRFLYVGIGGGGSAADQRRSASWAARI
jgi:hypothetical protein